MERMKEAIPAVKEATPPAILEFARAIRDQFGVGVTLKRGLPWPGGSR